MTRKSPLSVSGGENFIDKTMRKQQRSDLQAPDITANEAVGHEPPRYRVDSLIEIGECLFHPEHTPFPSDSHDYGHHVLRADTMLARLAIISTQHIAPIPPHRNNAMQNIMLSAFAKNNVVLLR
jgi:hypothetical protein